MSVCGWIIAHLWPGDAPQPDTERLDAALTAATHAQRRVSETAQGATEAVRRQGVAVQAERARIRERSAQAAQKRRVGQTGTLRDMVSNMLAHNAPQGDE